METVRDVLADKGKKVVTVSPDSTIFEALSIMKVESIGAVLVVDDAGDIAGILSERDYARKIVLDGKSSKDTAVSQIMTTKVAVIKPDNTVEEAMALMSEKRCRHLPVLEDGRLCGIISIGDVVRAVIQDKEVLINQLERYISSSL
ncbi:MAG: CBS domain-containing protein [Spirochaetaceae bacterium]|nr:MAG: CBS domain-containing protein [Spirochaetaceae bacterium]